MPLDCGAAVGAGVAGVVEGEVAWTDIGVPMSSSTTGAFANGFAAVFFFVAFGGRMECVSSMTGTF